MRQSKSLGSLALWSDRSRNASKSQLGSSAAPEEQWPTCADQYELLEDCGKGVSAVVYQARCLTNGKLVAIKALNLEALMCPLEDIMHEAQTMKTYKHDAVLQLYCSFVTGQDLWMVMPYMEGGSVAHILRYRYPDGLQEVVIATIMRKVLEALAYVHKQGDIHRDVKAGNVLVDAEGNVKLGDFGVAATLEREGEWGHTKPRLTFVGTPCWMAPEVLEQVDGYGTSADIWSFGITMLEMAHGNAPFSKLPPMKVLLQTLQGPPPQLEASCGGRHFSRSMREVVARCLNKDPAKRPTAKELLEHRFFKQAKDAEFLKRTLLADLPTLPQRCNEIRAGKAATLARENDRAAVASRISYMTDVAQWDFNCMKGIASGLGRDSQPTSGPNSGRERDQQSPVQLQQGPSVDVTPSAGAAAEARSPAEVVRVLSRDVPAAAGPDQQQKVAADQGPVMKEAAVPSSSGSATPTSPHAAATAAQNPSAPTVSTAASPQSPRLAAYCFAGGKQVVTIPLSVPGTPDQSPSSSRPTTPNPFAAAAAAPAADGVAGALRPVITLDSRPGTAGSGLSAKRHGRFTIIEGSHPYEGPEISGNSGSLPSPLSPLARQRSFSTPDICKLGALKSGDSIDSFVLPAAAKPAAVQPAVQLPAAQTAVQQAVQPPIKPAEAAAAVAVPAPHGGVSSVTAGVAGAAGSTATEAAGSTVGSAAVSPGRTGLLSRFLADLALKRQSSPAKQQQRSPQRGGSPREGQQQQQQLAVPLLKRRSREPSPRQDALSLRSGSGGHVGSSSACSLARPGASLSEIYPITPPAAVGSSSSTRGSCFVQQQQQQAQSLSRPAAALREVYPAGSQQQQHIAAEMWGHVKDVCSEAVAHVAQPFRAAAAAAAYHSPRQKSPDPHQLQQQQHVQRGDSGESATNALIGRDSYSSYGSAAALSTVSSTGGSMSSSSRPPRYQQGPSMTPRQQQLQQQGGAAAPATVTSPTAVTADKHRKSVSFVGLTDEQVAAPVVAAAAAASLLSKVPAQSAAPHAESATHADQSAAPRAESAGNADEWAASRAESVTARAELATAADRTQCSDAQASIRRAAAGQQQQQQQGLPAAAASFVRQDGKQADGPQPTDVQAPHDVSFSQHLACTTGAVAAASTAGAAALAAGEGGESKPAADDGLTFDADGGKHLRQQQQHVVRSPATTGSVGSEPTPAAAVQPDAATPSTPVRGSGSSMDQPPSCSTPVHRPEVTLVLRSPAEQAAAAAADGTPVKLSHRGRFTITET